MEVIKVRGARTHNLKNIDIDIPINKITTIYGASGSGKSSLAFGTLFLESKRRFINSFPNDVKFFWDIPNVADVDVIEPVLPVWGLAQKNPILSSRWNVFDYLGISEKLKKIFFHIGNHLCTSHNIKLIDLEQFIVSPKMKDNSEDVFHGFIKKNDYELHYGTDFLPARTCDQNFNIGKFVSDHEYFEIFRVRGNYLSAIEGKINSLGKNLDQTEIFLVNASTKKKYTLNKIKQYQCPKCDFSIEKIIDEHQLSPLNSRGACKECEGHGSILLYDPKKLIRKPFLSISEGAITILESKSFSASKKKFIDECKNNNICIFTPFYELDYNSVWDLLENGSGAYKGLLHLYKYFERKKYKTHIRIFKRSLQSEVTCKSCHKTRLNGVARKLNVISSRQAISYSSILKSDIDSLERYLPLIEKAVHESKKLNLLYLLGEIRHIVRIAKDIGISHLNLTAKLKDLNSSEYQRLLLVKYLSYKGSGSLFVLDEPSTGLSQEELLKVYEYLKELSNQGNTILIVDHSETVKQLSDHTIQMGPSGGHQGGQVIYTGPPLNNYKNETLQLQNEAIGNEFINVESIIVNELTPKSFKLPYNSISWAVGNSNTQKEKYIINGLLNEIYFRTKGEYLFYDDVSYKKIELRQSPFKDALYLNSTLSKMSSRSTVGTYLSITPAIRKHYSGLSVSKAMDLKDGHFSPNSKLGMCLSCEGKGVKTTEMSFLEDVIFTCDDCEGMKLKKIYAQISNGTLSFNEAVNLPLSKIAEIINFTPKIKRTLDYLKLLKLDYLSVDRGLSTLSGGELQRLRILSALQSNVTDSFIVFENVSFGLSTIELKGLFDLLSILRGDNNTIVIIDQNEHMRFLAQYMLKFSLNSVTCVNNI